LTKYAVSLETGNILKAVAVQRGQLKGKSQTDAGKAKLWVLTKELARGSIHPAQKYIATKLGDAGATFTNEKEVVTK
ncbi:hypothetical protein, partial [Gelidibacter salicanalis]